MFHISVTWFIVGNESQRFLLGVQASCPIMCEHLQVVSCVLWCFWNKCFVSSLNMKRSVGYFLNLCNCVAKRQVVIVPANRTGFPAPHHTPDSASGMMSRLLPADTDSRGWDLFSGNYRGGFELLRGTVDTQSSSRPLYRCVYLLSPRNQFELR